MNSGIKLRTPIIAFSILVATAGGVFAAEHKDDRAAADHTAMQMQAKITLGDAIQAAEASEGGKATGAFLDNENGKAVYEIDFGSSGDDSRTVLVDADTGTVMASSDERGGSENAENDEEDGHENIRSDDDGDKRNGDAEEDESGDEEDDDSN